MKPEACASPEQWMQTLPLYAIHQLQDVMADADV
jgi:hypothetical protein